MKTKQLKDIKTVKDVDGLNSIEVRTIASQLKIKNVSKFKKDELVDQIKKEIELRSNVDKAVAEEDVQKLRETTTKVGEEVAAEEAAKADIAKETPAEKPAETKKEVKKETKKEEKPKTEKKEAAKKEPKAPKTLPNPDSKSMTIYTMLKKGDKSKYAIAKELDTYYSVVDRVDKRYIQPELEKAKKDKK